MPWWQDTQTSRLGTIQRQVLGRESVSESALRERAGLLGRLMRDDPRHASEFMLSDESRRELLSRFPRTANWLESAGQWQGELVSMVVDDLERGATSTQHYVTIGDREYRLNSVSPIPAAACRTGVSVQGFRLGNDVLATSVRSAQALTAAGCTTTGEQRTAVILASMPSAPLPPQVTPALLQAAFFSTAGRSVDGFYREASYGKAWLSGSVFGPFQLDADYDCSKTTDLVRAAVRAADATVNFRNYSRVIVVAPRNGSCAIGIGSIGCTALTSPSAGVFTASFVFLGADYLTSNDAVVSVASHEMGHNLGLAHSNSRDYGAEALGPLGAAARDTEYGDNFSMMGVSYSAADQFILGHFNAPHKQRLGWLSGEVDYQDVQAGGTFTLSAYSAKTGLKALRVRRGSGSDEWLWLEYRQPAGNYDTSLASYSPLAYGGVLVHHDLASETFGRTFLLDMSPFAAPNDFRLAPLLAGSQWDDPYTNLTLQATAAPNGLEIHVIYRSGACAYTLQPASMTVPADGGRFYFDVTTASGCAYQALADAGFVSLATGARGVGSGRIYFDVAANSVMSPRTTTITVSGSTFALTQAAASWHASLGPDAATVGAGGGTATVNVTISGQAPGWTASSSASWVQALESSGSPGSGWVTYAVAPNLGPTPRTAVLTIAGTGFAITQPGGNALGNGGVSTIAGLTPVGASGGRTAGVSFHSFQRMDLDAQGNLYIAEAASHRIRKITAEGEITTIAGSGLPESSGDGGAAALAQTHAPRAICVDPWGNVFFSDASGLRKISAAGEMSMVDPKGAGADAIAWGPDGSLYLTLFQNIERLTPQGQWVHFAGTGTQGFGGDGGPAATAQLTNPGELAVDHLGRVYIDDGGNSRIRMVDTHGVISTVAGTGSPGFSGDGGPALKAELNYPAGLTLDPLGAMVVSDDKHIRRIANGVIQSIAGLQECGASADSGLASASRLGIPESVRFLPDGSYFYLSGFDKKIRKVDVAGQISVYAGNNTSIGDGGAGNSAAFDFAYSDGKIARDPAGSLYIADRDHHRVRKLSADGVVSTFVGTGANDSGADRLTAAQTAVMYPSAVAFNPAGELYIGEEARVRKVLTSGGTVSVAGTGEPGFSGDGGPATSAKIQQVTGLAIDPSGNVYIATQDCRVRRVAASGVISAFAGTGQCGSDGDGGPAAKTRMGMARDIVADAAGNVYIAVGSSIRRVDSNGVITTLTTQDGSSDFYPFGLFLATDGELYFSSGTRISKLTVDGQRVDIAGWGENPGEGVQPAQARLYDASGLLLDPEGNLIFAEGGADGPHRIRKISFGFALDRTDVSFPAAGGSGSVQATAPSSTYSWSVSGNTSWLHVAPGGFMGSGTVSFTVDANASPQARAGLLTIGDRFLLVRQYAAGIAPPALQIRKTHSGKPNHEMPLPMARRLTSPRR